MCPFRTKAFHQNYLLLVTHGYKGITRIFVLGNCVIFSYQYYTGCFIGPFQRLYSGSYRLNGTVVRFINNKDSIWSASTNRESNRIGRCRIEVFDSGAQVFTQQRHTREELYDLVVETEAGFRVKRLLSSIQSTGQRLQLCTLVRYTCLAGDVHASANCNGVESKRRKAESQRLERPALLSSTATIWWGQPPMVSQGKIIERWPFLSPPWMRPLFSPQQVITTTSMLAPNRINLPTRPDCQYGTIVTMATLNRYYSVNIQVDKSPRSPLNQINLIRWQLKASRRLWIWASAIYQLSASCATNS